MKKNLLLILILTAFQLQAQVPVLVKDIATSFVYTHSDPSQFTSFNGKTYFTAEIEARTRLWVTDGTESGTYSLSNQIESPQFLGTFKNKLYFRCFTSEYGTELWYTDGTVEGTKILKDINPNSGSSDPRLFTVAGNNLFFAAFDGTHGTEWWVSDGTEEGTKLTFDLEPMQGRDHGQFRTAIPFGNTIIFSRIAHEADRGDVWILHGDKGVPINLTEQFPSVEFKWQNAVYMVYFNEKVYFNFNLANEGNELFYTNGTIEGTKLLNLVPGSGGISPQEFFVFKDKLLFTGSVGGIGVSKVHISDGTEAGTFSTNLAIVNPYYTVLGDHLLFVGDDGKIGVELWKTDGTIEGTQLVKDINPGFASSAPTVLRFAGGKVYFTANNGTNNGFQPWVSDGTEAGTFLLQNIFFNGTQSSWAQNFTELDGVVYFTARKALNDFHLFRTNGTPEGTYSIKPDDATVESNPLGIPGTIVRPPTPLKVNNGMIFFRANYHGVGRELYRIGEPQFTDVTEKPSLTNVAKTGNNIEVQFTLPEAAKAGSVKLLFHNTNGEYDENAPHVITLSSSYESAQSHSIILKGTKLSQSSGVVSVNTSPQDKLVHEAIYSVEVSYMDEAGNPEANDTFHDFLFIEDVTTSLNEKSSAIQSVYLFPNPTRGNFQVKIDEYYGSEEVSALLFSMEGKVLLNQTVKTDQLGNILSEQLQGFRPGSYLLRLTFKNETKDLKLIKQ